MTVRFAPVTEPTPVSLSHWGLFMRELRYIQLGTVHGRDASGNPISESTEWGIYDYRPLQYTDEIE